MMQNSILGGTVLLMMFHAGLSNGKPPHKLLLVSFDGFRSDYAARRPDLEGFEYLMQNGVTADYLKSAFPTQTSPNHFSIATGMYTESHGVVHNLDYNISSGEVRSTFFSALKVNEWWDNGADPIWITAVNQGLTSGGYLYPGSYANMSGVGATKSVLDTANKGGDEDAWRTRVDDVITWFVDDDLDMIALYFEDPDKTSHAEGPDSPVIAEETLPKVSTTILYLIQQVEAAGLTDDLNIIIVSDHGFAEIDTSVRRPDAIELNKYVDQSLITFQLSYGPLGLVQPIPGMEEYVRDQLQKGNPHMEVYLKRDLPERWFYKRNDRITEVVVVAHPGYSVYPIFPGFHVNTGEHGYDNDLTIMMASYFSIGPSFKKNYKVRGFENIHIYPLMCHLLGLEPSPNNGSFEVLRETLVADSSASSNFHLSVFTFLYLPASFLVNFIYS